MSPVDLQKWFPSTYGFWKALARMSRGAGRGIAFLVRKTYKYTLGFFIVLAVAHGIFSIVLGRRLERELMAIKASGAPIAMAQMGEPKVPDSENGAIIYAKVIEGMDGMILYAKGGEPIKQPSAPKDLDTVDSFTTLSERSKNPKLWDDARPVVAKYRPLIPLIEQAASKPECQFAVNWEAGAGALFPHFSVMRRMKKLLQANALLEARDGNMDEAVRSVELSFKVSRSLKDDPSLIGQLVRIGVLRTSSQSLREIMQYGSISEAQAKRLDSTLAQPGMLPSLDRAMLGERCFGLWEFEYVRENPAGFPSFLEGSGGTARFPMLWRALGDVWRPFFYADELAYLRYMNRAIEVWKRPYRDIHGKPELSDPTAQLPKYAIISTIMLPVFTRPTIGRDDSIAGIAGSRILLGLQAYKDRYGYYPVNLEALKSQLGWELPTDPFSGKDFIYRLRGDGFLLYGVGENLKDDGGRKYPVQIIRHDASSHEHPYSTLDGQFSDDMIWEMDH